MSRYDLIGEGYAQQRQPDPRIARLIDAALGPAVSVANIGAGTGSYEPADRAVVAVEPSATMIAQRAAGSAPAIRGLAEAVPFRDASFDAAMAILTIHHWSNVRSGLREMRRIARDRVVLLTWDPAHDGFWLVRDYCPDVIAIDRQRFPTMDDVSAVLGDIESTPIPVPHDCIDGFLGAHWRRPAAYLDPRIRRSMSTFSLVSGIDAGLERLRVDLHSGRWTRRNAALLALDELDLGYRLVVAQV